jgi:predicted nucleic acid-binding protein
MPAVSDSGPLIHLAQTNQIRLLKRIFGPVLVVPAVKREVVDEGIRGSYPDAKLVAEALEEGYIIVRKTDSRTSKRASGLARREKISEADSQTLLLAKALRKPLLTDEKILSTLAKMYGVEVWNTWTVLLEALRTKVIEKHEIHQAINELSERRHKLSPTYAKQVLGAADRITAPKT